ncbi:MAG TPA: hypothetical protein VG841_00725 [Caulobacterales bacterium]|nr:hypothetical protein [Caulobacterales bacterium]
MTALRNGRAFVLLCSAAAVAGAVCFAIAPNLARADDKTVATQLPPAPIDFTDPAAQLSGESAQINVTTSDEAPARYLPVGRQDDPAPSGARNYELQVTASGDSVGVPLDLSIAQRGNFSADDAGDLSRRGRGAELRIGANVAENNDARSAPAPGWYAFAASDDQALVWNPGTRNAFGNRGGGFSLQDRVEIGDHQAGVTYETGAGVQASIAYVERSVNAHVGSASASHDESFAGVTVTMRH